MKIRRRFGLIAAGVLLSVTAAVGVAVSASAGTSPDICATSGGSLCMNDWNGGGAANPINSGGLHWTNSDFDIIPISFMCHDGHVHANAPYGPCPFANGSGLNTQLDGAGIYMIKHNANGLCVGTTSASTLAIMVGCPDALGNGGGYGTINAIGENSSCNAAGIWYLINRYWSNAYGHQTSMRAGSSNGLQDYVDVGTGTATCWHQIS